MAVDDRFTWKKNTYSAFADYEESITTSALPYNVFAIIVINLQEQIGYQPNKVPLYQISHLVNHVGNTTKGIVWQSFHGRHTRTKNSHSPGQQNQQSFVKHSPRPEPHTGCVLTDSICCD